MKVEKVENLSEEKWLNRMQMAQFECPKHWNPSVSFISGVGWIPFSDYWPSWVIRMGSPVWKCKSWKFIRTKVTQQDANGPVWMSQALKPLCLLHFLSWEFFFLSLFWKLKVIQQWFNGDASKDFMFEPRLTVALSFFTIFSLSVLAAFSASAVCRLAPTYLSLSVTSRGWSAALFTV